MIENNLSRLSGHLTMGGVDGRGVRSTDLHVNLRGKGKNIALARVFDTYGPSAGLRRAELDRAVVDASPVFLLNARSRVFRWMAFLTVFGVA